MILLFVPADLFNSIDLRYRATFWSDISGIPALIAFALNAVAVHRIKKRQLRGWRTARAGMILSAFWVVGALFGLGVINID